MLNHRNIDTSTTLNFDCYNMDEMTAEWYEGLIHEHSHDVRGRIMSLKLSLYLMEKQLLSGDVQHLIDRMKGEMNDLTRMVQDLYDHTNPCDS